MFLLRVSLIYAILFSSLALIYVNTSFNNPAFMFFVPSICAMLFLARIKLSDPSVKSAPLALVCGLCFACITVLCLLLFEKFAGELQRGSLMYAMAFGGNFVFPILMFPSIKRAQK